MKFEAIAMICLFASLPGEADPLSESVTQQRSWIENIRGNPAIDTLHEPRGPIGQDLSGIWLTDHRQSTLGYLGASYRRFRLRFQSVVKNGRSPARYRVSGKTKVDDRICGFSGWMEVDHAWRYGPAGRSGDTLFAVLAGAYSFSESKRCPDPGDYKGTFSSKVFFDRKGKPRYDDLEKEADGFENNSFVGTRKSLSTGRMEICNWGDHRIPFSEGLDQGTGEFYPAEPYVKNGWEGLLRAQRGDPQARDVENAPWWK